MECGHLAGHAKHMALGVTAGSGAAPAERVRPWILKSPRLTTVQGERKTRTLCNVKDRSSRATVEAHKQWSLYFLENMEPGHWGSMRTQPHLLARPRVKPRSSCFQGPRELHLLERTGFHQSKRKFQVGFVFNMNFLVPTAGDSIQ